MMRLSNERRSPRAPVLVAVSAVLGLALLGSSPASASPVYPTTIEETLGMPCAPTCELCHLTTIGRGGNATQPFALALVDAGLVSNDPELLRTLLTSLSGGASTTDSDGDGTPDIAELEAESPTDPNDPTGASICGGGAEYGCGVAPASSVSGAPIALGLLGALGFLARRRALRLTSR